MTYSWLCFSCVLICPFHCVCVSLMSVSPLIRILPLIELVSHFYDLMRAYVCSVEAGS